MSAPAARLEERKVIMIALLSVAHVVDEGAQLLQLFGADAFAADQRGEKLVRRTVEHLID